MMEVGGQSVVIEYDGAYWHAHKFDVDERKTRDLLAAGHRVVRLREAPLPSLGIMDANYLEVEVFTTAPRPQAVMEVVAQWVHR